ncbi:MAG TPA: AI-2E family transporter [Tessaracoccus flavescens]|uniref:AI-2E family transporter n=1 Tax=Tessaracoccus flavescens TaxID=399497 RepID=A0A921JQW6_9ACTN|nr:AI-2E family transporter [Tessaracoccus flavescens]
MDLRPGDGINPLGDASGFLPAPDPEQPVDKADVIGEGGRWLAAWAARFLLIAAAVVVIGWVIGKMWAGVLPVLLALLVASVLWPFTNGLKRRGVPYGIGAFTSLLIGVGVVAGLVSLIAPGVVAQWPILSTQAVVGVRRLQMWASGPPLNLRDEQLNEWITQGITYLQSRSGDLFSQALSLGGSLSSGIVTVLLTLVLTFFFLKDGHRFLGFTRQVVGRRAGFHATELLTRLWTTVSGYIRTQAIVSLVDAVFIGLGLVVLGVPLAFPLAVLTFMAGFIPVVGAITAGALAVLVAVVSNGWTTAALVLLLILLVQQLEGNVLQPILQSRVMKLHPVVVLLAVLIGGAWFGIIGAFLAVPVAASIAVCLRYLGDLVDLRTGDRSTDDVEWATADGKTVGSQSEQAAAFFRALVRVRTTKKEFETQTETVVEGAETSPTVDAANLESVDVLTVAERSDTTPKWRRILSRRRGQ